MIVEMKVVSVLYAKDLNQECAFSVGRTSEDPRNHAEVSKLESGIR